MHIPESEGGTELLKTISITLKGILTSLEHLTAAVEGVAESIEKAHEPEGDLGVQLVGSLKELGSALQKRAQQERGFQPQQGQRQHNPNRPQGRREDRQQQHPHQRNSARDPEETDASAPYSEDREHGAPRDHDESAQDLSDPEEVPNTPEKAGGSDREPAPQAESAMKRARTNRRRRSGAVGRAESS